MEVQEEPKFLGLTIPVGYSYKWENNAVYVSRDDGKTWQLFMYFPER